MKLFQQKTSIELLENLEELIKVYEVNAEDFIIISKSLYQAHLQKLVEKLQIKPTIVFKSKYGSGEPTDLMIEELRSDFRKTSCKRLIAIGGGAVIDMAKLLIIDAVEDDGTINYEASIQEIFQKKVSIKRTKAFIAVPTTCGAGSEVSNITIAELNKLETKLGLAVNELYPDYAVLIPELLRELPYNFFLTSAIDALIHAIESFVSPRATMYTEMFSKQAIRMIVQGFQRIVEEGEDVRFELLEDFLVASNMAGVAFGNAGTGSVHAMSYPLSGKYHVTHGEANYQFFTAVFQEYNRKNPTGKLAVMNQMLSQVFACEEADVYAEMERLLDQLIPRKPLHTYGMKEEEIELFTDSVLQTQIRLLNQSYVLFSRNEMIDIYRSLY